MKKILSLLLVIAMMVTLAVTVSAEETGNLSITREGITTYYQYIYDALEAAEDGDTIKVERSYTEDFGWTGNVDEDTFKSVTFDLNGKEIHFPEEDYCAADHGFLDIYDVNATFIDTVGGGIIHALVAPEGSTVVKGGTYRGFWACGEVTIEGGTFLGLPQEIVDQVWLWDATEKSLIGTKGLLLTTSDRVFLTEDAARAALDALLADGYVANKPYDITPYEMDGETRYSAGFAANTKIIKTGYDTTVTYTVAPTFTVTIPATVALGEDATISAENVVVPKGKQVEVSIAEANGFKATTPEGAEITYTVKNGETAVAEGETVLAVNPGDGNTGSTTLSFVAPQTVQYAGIYTGTVTFTVAVKDVPVTTISFTIYNPAGDSTTEYSAEKGMTWGDWLESTYNNAGFAVRSDGGITYITIGSRYDGVALELSFLVEDFVKSTDVIQKDYEYVWMQIGG